MPSFHLLDTTRAPRVPWAGGAGSSVELARWPGVADPERTDFELRISLERVEADGPYPSLSGFEHFLLPVSAGTSARGLELAHGDGAPPARVRRGEVARFPGGWTTRVTALDGGIEFVAAAVRTGRAQPVLQLLDLGLREAREPLAPIGLLLVARGNLEARMTDEEEAFELQAGEGVWIEDAREGDEAALGGRRDDTLVVLVHIRP